ncbi:hypothetical protein F4703DRAFT_1890952 [Phycomyces blakesleeanus]
MTVGSNKFVISVGIDFGTSSSGCSYAYMDDAAVTVIDIPDRARNIKTPTQSLYRKNTKEFVCCGFKAVKQGNRHETGYDLITNVKMALNSRSKDPKSSKHSLETVDVIRDYFRNYYIQIMKYLKSKDPSLNDPSRFRYCLTVPNLYSDNARLIMRRAVIEAGIVKKDDICDQLLIINESEAAGLWCEHISPNLDLTHDKYFMICDAGGYSVDVSVLQIDTSSGKSFREVIASSGSFCGSMCLDDCMERLLRNRLYLRDTSNKHIKRLMDEFVNTIKPEFDGTQNVQLTLPEELRLIFDPMAEIGEGKLYISVREMKEDVFDPIIRHVIHLIRDQFKKMRNKHIHVMFVTGGFGESPYLTHRIKEAFESRLDFLHFLREKDGAVRRGAALFGLNPEVIDQRILQRTYGFNSVIKDGFTKRNCFTIWARKGQPIRENMWIEGWTSWVRGETKSISLYSYDGDEPVKMYKPQGAKLVAKFDTQFRIALKPGKDRANLNIFIRFCLGNIRVKVNIIDKTYTYPPQYYDNELLSPEQNLDSSGPHLHIDIR